LRAIAPQVRLVLALAVGLCLVPAAFIAVAEWGGTLGHLGVVDRLVNALFQSVTLRTAGFNSIDLTAIHPATYALTIPLMFIGGSPGSTAGGIKTTTMAVLYALVRSAFRPDGRATLLGHQIDGVTLRKAAAVATLGAASVFALLVALLLTQPLTLDQAIFETVSALGTVGLTVGGTSQLDDAGKLLISLGMLAGRVGPLSLLMLLLDRSEPGSRVDPPRLGVDVG
jgi:trk system potassium uptake protein TrkH